MEPIRIENRIRIPVATSWKLWTSPAHVTRWYTASPDWHTPLAESDLHPGGTFSFRMEAKDGSAGFDFTGTYDAVEKEKLINYTLDDGRKVTTKFLSEDGFTRIRQAFEPESTHPADVQKKGWQSILDNFKRYAEALYREES